MNLINIFPRKLRESYKKNLLNSGLSNVHKYVSRMLVYSLILSFIVPIFVYIFRRNDPLIIYFVLVSFFGTFILAQIFVYLNVSLKSAKRIRKIEKVFPDFIGLMASNLRAGMTVEDSFLRSARPELAPLDEVIRDTGKEIATGKSMVSAFEKMSEKIDSEKVAKIVSLIVSGLRTGGNISTLLQTTASNMRERDYLERRASSNVLMYVIFIFVAVGIGSPILFGLSSVLVEIIIELTGQLPDVGTGQMDMPFTMSGVAVPLSFIIYFAVGFILITDFISSLLLGLVNEGNEKYGLKYLLPLIALSMTIFFLVRIVLSNVLIESFLAIS